MPTPKWSSENLNKHHQKRLTKDDHCWREILGIDRPMTCNEYEEESGNAYRKGALEYEAEYSRHYQALYRADKRSVLSVCDLRRLRMITCYHKHFHGRHETGSVTPKLENLLEFVDDLEAALDGELEKLFRIEPVKENLSGTQLKKYINPKLKNLRSRCVKSE